MPATGAPTPILRPVAGVSAVEGVRQQLRARIHEGHLGPGDRLPPERELAEQLAVSRLTLREALRHLQAEGYLITRRGATGGTFVTALEEPLAAWREAMRHDVAELDDILDHRIAVERRAAELAAGRRTARHLAAMERAIAELGATADVRGFRSADAAFHEAMAAAARSPRLAAAVASARSELFSPTDVLFTEADVEVTAREHGELLDAIRRGSPPDAGAAAERHLETTRAQLRRLLGIPATRRRR